MKNNIDTSGWDTQFNNIQVNLSNLTDDIDRYLINYFKHSFVTKSFGNDRWKPSRHNNNTLVDSGELKNSIKTIVKTPRLIHIQSDTPYSAIHNYGGNIRITDKMRKFFWAKFYSTGNSDWKWMALTSNNYITIPKRQFMGWNNDLRRKIDNIILDIVN